MKIFSNFDTGLDEDLYAKAVEKFGQARVLFVRRDKIYLILKIWIPLGLWFLFSCLCLLLYYMFVGGESGIARFFGGLLWLIIIFLGVYVGYVCVKKLIDYHMDYCIVTPIQVIQYDQTGVLGRSTRSLDITKIKTISINKKGLLGSIFNYGSIVFFSEGDQSGGPTSRGDITLNYISNPTLLKDAITNILQFYGSGSESKGSKGDVSRE